MYSCFSAVGCNYRRCVSLVEQIIAKQTNINANLLRKVAMLEKMLHTKFNHHHLLHHHHHQQQQQQWRQSNARPQDRTSNDALAPGYRLATYSIISGVSP